MRHDDVHNWNPPAAGTKERDAMPQKAFLGPDKSYPFMYENAEGEWVESEQGLEAARTAAQFQQNRAVFEDATRRLNKIREARGEEPLNMDAFDVESNKAGVLVELYCKNLIDEANAIIDYTKRIKKAQDAASKNIFAELRHDELGHVQKLTVGLTEILSGNEPLQAERMDGFGQNKGDKRITIECRDPENTIQELLEHLKSIGNMGHSFKVVVDPGDPGHMKEFYVDGDGPDYFYSIKSDPQSKNRGAGD